MPDGVPTSWSSLTLRLAGRAAVNPRLALDLVRTAWAFLRPYVEPAAAYVFSRQAFAWEGLDPERIEIIRPSIDPFSPKNQQLGAEEILRGPIVIEEGNASGRRDDRRRRCRGRRRRDRHRPVAHLRAAKEEQRGEPSGNLLAFAGRDDIAAQFRSLAALEPSDSLRQQLQRSAQRHDELAAGFELTSLVSGA